MKNDRRFNKRCTNQDTPLTPLSNSSVEILLRAGAAPAWRGSLQGDWSRGGVGDETRQAALLHFKSHSARTPEGYTCIWGTPLGACACMYGNVRACTGPHVCVGTCACALRPVTIESHRRCVSFSQKAILAHSIPPSAEY